MKLRTDNGLHHYRKGTVYNYYKMRLGLAFKRTLRNRTGRSCLGQVAIWGIGLFLFHPGHNRSGIDPDLLVWRTCMLLVRGIPYRPRSLSYRILECQKDPSALFGFLLRHPDLVVIPKLGFVGGCVALHHVL